MSSLSSTSTTISTSSTSSSSSSTSSAMTSISTASTSSRYTRGPGFECRTPASPPAIYTTPVWAPRPTDRLTPLGDAVPTPVVKEPWVAPGAERFSAPRPLPVCIPALALRSRARPAANLPEVKMERSLRHYPSRRVLSENHYFRVRKDQAGSEL